MRPLLSIPLMLLGVAACAEAWATPWDAGAGQGALVAEESESEMPGPERARARVAHPLLSASPGLALPPLLRRAPEWTAAELEQRTVRQARSLAELQALAGRVPVAVPGGLGLDAAGLDLLRRAGRRAPPGLPTARRVQHEAARRDALDELRAALAADPRGAALRAALVGVLADRLPVPEALWIEFAGAAGGVVSLVPEAGEALVAELERASHTRRASAARRALRDGLGLWFKDGAALRSYLGAAPSWPGAGELERLAAEESRRLSLLGDIWSLEPARALTALDAVSPEERGRAALALVEGVRRPGTALLAALEALAPGADALTALVDLLLDCAAFESDPEALCRQFEALGALLGAGEPQRLRLLRARGLLEDGVRNAPLELAVCLGRAIAALPPRLADEPRVAALVETAGAGAGASLPEAGGTQAEGTDPPEQELAAPTWGLEQLTRWIGRVSAAPRLDEDLVVGLLDSVGTHVRASGEPSGSPQLAAAVLELARDLEASNGLRLAAIAALRDLARPADLGALAEWLATPGLDPDCGYALLGVVAHVVETREVDPADRAAVLQAGLALLLSEQLDLRRGAIELLASERLVPEFGDPAAREGLAAAAVRESDPALVDAILRLLPDRAGPQELATILEGGLLARRLEESPDAAPALLGDLLELAGDERALGLAACSEVLEHVQGPARALLLDAALGFGVDEVAPPELAELPRLQAAELLRWASELERFEARWTPFPAARQERFGRLLDEVLPRLPEELQPEPLEQARLSAAAGRPLEELQAELRLASAGPRPAAQPELELARLALRVPATEAALAAYRRHVEGAPSEDRAPAEQGARVRLAWLEAPTSRADLEPGDLRRLLDLTAAPDATRPGESWRADVAAGAGLALLRHPLWVETDLDAALLDVDRVAAAVRRSAWRAGTERLAATLAAALDGATQQLDALAPGAAGFWLELVAVGRPRLELARERLADAGGGSGAGEMAGENPGENPGESDAPTGSDGAEDQKSSTVPDPDPIGG